MTYEEVAKQKQCTKCNEWKPETPEYFARNKNGKNGLLASCKACQAIYFRQHYADRREERQEYARRHYAENAEQIKEYKRRWYSTNREKDMERRRRYYIEHREQERENSHRYYVQHAQEKIKYWRQYRLAYPDKIKETQRRYYAEHLTEIKESRHEYYVKHAEEKKKYWRQYRTQNRAEVKLSRKNWAIKHPEKIREYHVRRRSFKRGLPFEWTSDDEKRALMYWNGYCPVCGEPLCDLFGERMLHFDHWIPLSDPRPDNPGTISSNILPLCNKCNCSKGNLDSLEWLVNKFGKRKALFIIDKVKDFFCWTEEQRQKDPIATELPYDG